MKNYLNVEDIICNETSQGKFKWIGLKLNEVDLAYFIQQVYNLSIWHGKKYSVYFELDTNVYYNGEVKQDNLLYTCYIHDNDINDLLYTYKIYRYNDNECNRITDIILIKE